MIKQGLIGGRYSLREPLGSGGMAEVFLAHDEVLERDVALKVLKERYADDEGFVERFRREARSAASLNHPQIIVVYDWGRSEDDGAYYMAMEYAPGGTLKDRILGDGALPPRTAVAVALQIAGALQAAHGRGVVHRDVKPRNVLLSASGDVKVADFGIARAATATTTSRSSPILGTVGYMSPEQAMGETVGPRSDLYSLGVVLYEMLTGRVPREADTPVAVATEHITEPLRSPREANPEIPEELDALVMRLLTKDPADRYGSAAELAEDLRRIGGGLSPAFAAAEPVPANPDGDSGAHGPPAVVYGRRSRKLPWTLAMAFVALLVLLGTTAWDPRSGSQEQARAQDVAPGSLDELGEALEKDEQMGSPEEEALVAESLPEDEGRGSPAKADTGSLRLVALDPASSDTVFHNGVTDQAPGAGVPEEPGTEVANATVSSEPERAGVPEVSEGSVEEAPQVLSDDGHAVADTAARRSSESAGTDVGTDPPVGSTVERETAVTSKASSSRVSQRGSNGDEDAAAAAAAETTTAPAQPSKTRKWDQKPSE